MNRKFALIICLVLGAGLGIYAYLGGFSPVQVVKTTSKTVYIAGRYFSGNMKEKELGALFQQAALLLEQKKINGHLGNIYYNNPEDAHDSIRAFIGIVVPDSAVKLPAAYELRKWPGGQPVLQAAVKAHFFLAPNKLYQGLFDYAKDQKLTLRKRYLEEFPENRYGLVQAELVAK